MKDIAKEIFEEYEVKDTAIYANVNASKVVDMMKRFIEMHDEPMFFILELPCKNKEISFDELIGKVLLVGITYYTHDNEYIEQKQFYGTVTEANETIIRVKQKDGTDFTLPPDLSSTKRARQGEYKLRSTGEIVINPDFLATWNLNKAKEE